MVDEQKPYHHGNLAEVLVAAAVTLIEEGGVEALSLRAVARQVGVSPAAPFRHFASKQALLTAVAEQAMARLRARIDALLAAMEGDRPLAVLEAMGRAYLTWAAENPTHFEIISSRKLIDFNGSHILVSSNALLRATMVDLLESAMAAGELDPSADVDRLVLSMRAHVYGLARMRCDGQLSDWTGGEPADDATLAALRLYFQVMARG